MRIRHDVAGIAVVGARGSDEFLERKVFGPADFDDRIGRGLGRDGRQFRGDFGAGDRLNERGRHSDGISVGTGIGYARREFVECVARRIVYATPEVTIPLSCATLARMYPLSGMRSAPTTDSATW